MHDDRTPKRNRNLPRLDRSQYQGFAHVHWIFTINNRQVGYLTPEFFLNFQLIATHAFLRYQLAAPCVCLMPDHIHLLLVGTNEEDSDQKPAVDFLRKYLKEYLHPFEFQHPAYDHILRDHERNRDAFQETARYIRENPVRGGICSTAKEWPYHAAIIPGYPKLDPFADDFWELFWRIYHRLVDKS